MAVRHMNRVFMLQLPSSVRFVLLALARYANSDDDTCYPGIAKIADMTGYCEKTVVRTIRVLSRLGIIDIKKNPKGNNHIYTLYVTGDIKSWDEYLKSKAHVLKEMNRENQSTSITPKSIYKYSLYNKIEKGEEKEVEVTCDSSHVLQSPEINQTILGKDILDIPPGKRKSLLLKTWEESVPKYFKGLKVVIKAGDKWAIDEIYSKYEKDLPIYEFIEFIIIYWSKFSKMVRDHKDDIVAKSFPHIPDLSYLSIYVEYAVYMFWESKEEV